MAIWHELKGDNKVPPPEYRNVLLAFKEHSNQVVGFYCGKGEWYETSAHDNNSKIEKPGPDWWSEIPEVPHSPERKTQ